VKENCVWSIRTNQELTSFYRETDKKQRGRLRALGHTKRMLEEGIVTKVFKNTLGRKICLKAKKETTLKMT
jgi:hypothetical protein